MVLNRAKMCAPGISGLQRAPGAGTYHRRRRLITDFRLILSILIRSTNRKPVICARGLLKRWRVVRTAAPGSRDLAAPLPLWCRDSNPGKAAVLLLTPASRPARPAQGTPPYQKPLDQTR